MRSRSTMIRNLEVFEMKNLEKYSDDQIREIYDGLFYDGIPTLYYENPKFSVAQMHEIRLGLIARVDVELYNKVQWTSEEMRGARLALTLQREIQEIKEREESL